MNTNEWTSKIAEAKSAIVFAQELPPSPIYDLRSLGRVGPSGRTIRRRLIRLAELGLAEYVRGKFTIKREVVSQPYPVLQSIASSLMSLKKARRFGRHYKPTDASFVRRLLPEDSIVTLDHGAYDLTGFQTPLGFHVYVDDVEGVSQLLKRHGFREGKRGGVVLLPRIGSFENRIERIFLDCVANGGRSFLDAAAIMLTHGNSIKTRVRFAGDTILQVQGGLPANDADR